MSWAIRRSTHAVSVIRFEIDLRLRSCIIAIDERMGKKKKFRYDAVVNDAVNPTALSIVN